jgi:hypothetical protein
MGMWLLTVSCLGDPAACNVALGPWKELLLGNETRCMVEGESIVARNARINIDNNIVIKYSCRPYTEEDAKKDAGKARDEDDKDDKR